MPDHRGRDSLMTPDEIQKDRAAGTPGLWHIGSNNPSRVFDLAGNPVIQRDPSFRDAERCEANARRIARVPELEEAYLALTAENAALKARVAELGAALAGMLSHSCVADAGADMKCEEDHTAERKARAALEKSHE